MANARPWAWCAVHFEDHRMRLNLPVIDREFPFPKGRILVSTTDVQGRILHCNAAFVAVSGYAAEELLGQPHNLIRHPDMPEEAYRDLWATIQAGQPWSGTVKNRRKTGEHYWTLANVTPVLQGDEIVAYLSVRTEPDRNQVQACEALYATMRAEKAAGHLLHVLRAGQVLQTTRLSRAKRMWHWSLEMRLAALAAAAGAIGFGVAWAAQAGANLSAGWMGATAAATALVVGAFALPMLRAMVVLPLNELVAFANRMAACDLTQKLTLRSHGPMAALAQAMNQLNVNLRSVVTDAHDEAQQLSAALRELAAGNQSLAERTESQASSLQETTASMEQVTGNVKHNTEIAHEAARMAESVTEVAQRGTLAMGQMTETMLAISHSSKHIGDIIQVIDGIAFQTNILALNAAVEAARAGHQGRGFAVVAAEVRSLAQRSADAAKEVKRLIEESTQTVAKGDSLTEVTGQSIRDVHAAAQQVNSAMGNLRRGADEQLQGMSQISDAVNHIEGLTQKNAALVQEVAASAMHLQGRAQALVRAVDVFRIDGRNTVQPDAVSLRRQAKVTRAQAAQSV